jgi:transcriptional regulator with XRE-family HTH domain
MSSKITGPRRREIERTAYEIRLDCLRRGLATEETVDRILSALRPDIHPLEAWRFANGWTRSEVSAKLDMLYRQDDLAPPGIDQATLCRWEHGERKPGDERIDYLCRLYRTRPDRLGFGMDHSKSDIDHLHRVGIIDAYPYTGNDSERDLDERLKAAHERINLFGLTRNYYARDEFLSLLEEKAARIPVHIFVMDPECDSRKDRYRIEPAEAAMEDPQRYIREVLRPLRDVSRRHPRLRIYLYNFPCSFAIEEIDDVVRIMLYGHGKRGTQGPILTFSGGTSAHTYFIDQIRWLEHLAEEGNQEPWASKNIQVRPFDAE